MNFKEVLQSVKNTIQEKWKIIAIICGSLFLIAILLGIFWPKQQKESVKKEIRYNTNINRTYLKVIKKKSISNNLLEDTNNNQIQTKTVPEKENESSSSKEEELKDPNPGNFTK